MKKIIAIIIALALSCPMLTGCDQLAHSNHKISETQIEDICRLATYDLYYHNVAIKNIPKDRDYKIERHLWIEYTGIARVGVNLSKVDIKVNGSLVTVYLPNAEVLNIRVDDSSLNEDSYVVSRDRSFLPFLKNEITAEDESEAIEKAQEKMKKEVEENEKVLQKATNRAQELIEKYVDTINEQTGSNYKVEFKENAPEASPEASSDVTPSVEPTATAEQG